MPFITPEEYLEAEQAAEYKSQYYQGQVFAMSGASRAHNLLVKNLLVGLDTRLGENCNVYPSDLRVHVADNGLYTYPDVSVVCGPEEFLPDAHLDTLLNPTVLIEVLSRTTPENDQSRKFLLYRELSSLQHYVLVESLSIRVGVFTRTSPDSWTFQEYRGLGAALPLPALALELPLTEIYRKLRL